MPLWVWSQRPHNINRRVLAATLFLLIGTLCLYGCAASAHQQRDPNTIVILEPADADTLDPLFTSNFYGFLYQSFLFDGLSTVGDNFTDAPDLATSWSSTADGLHWVVNLRRGVQWSDGAPFTAKDVVFSWEAMLDAKTAFPYRGQFLYIKSVTADGPNRVRFDLKSRNALFTSLALGAQILPEHILGKIPHAQLRTSGFGEHPVGTGAYKLEVWRHDQDANFIANPRWWGKTQAVRRLTFQIVINEASRIDAMTEGAADVDDDIPASSFLSLQAMKTSLQLIRIPDLYTALIYVNFKRPGLDDVNVRRAMMYGWDREAVVNGLERGDDILATSITPTGLRRWYDPNVKHYPYDPERARAMLEQAGYHLAPDGVRVRGNVRLAYELTDVQRIENQEIDAAFQADMRAIGIAITLRTIDFATYTDKLQTGDYELGQIRWGGAPDPDQQTMFGCDQFPPNGNNDMYYCNRRVDRDVNLGLQTISYAQRKKIYDDMQSALAEDVPVLFRSYPYYQLAIAPRVHFDMSRLLPDQYLFRDIAHWQLGPL